MQTYYAATIDSEFYRTVKASEFLAESRRLADERDFDHAKFYALGVASFSEDRVARTWAAAYVCGAMEQVMELDS